MNLSLNRIKSQNQMTNIYIGSALLILSILDVFLNSFFRIISQSLFIIGINCLFFFTLQRYKLLIYSLLLAN